MKQLQRFQKKIKRKHIDGPLGVRNSNNDLVREKLNWDYSLSLEEGIEKTYSWIESQIFENQIIYKSLKDTELN